MLLPPLSENDELARLCRDLGCTVVRMGSAKLDDEAHLVASNDQEAVSEAVAWLAELGHRRIGFIAGPDGFRSARERELGFIAGMGRAGLTIDPALLARGTTDSNPGSKPGRPCSAAPIRPPRSFPATTKWLPGCCMRPANAACACRRISRSSALTIPPSPRISGRR
jgi:LacI family transcriptional regulator